LDGNYPLQWVNFGRHSTAKLSEIIERLNDLFGAEVDDQDKLHFANGIADRIERDEEVMAQIRGHSTEKVMHGLFPKAVTDAVLDAIGDNEKLSVPVLDSEETNRRFALLILELLVGRHRSSSPFETSL